MGLDISKHGDILEITYSKLILESLPNYNEIWKQYIGNNGKAHIIEVPGLGDDEARDRQSFAQNHYSCLESIIGMKIISEHIRTNKLGSIDEYVGLNSDFIAFQAHAGRIVDCLRRCGEIVRHGDVSNRLREYYHERNTVLHGCKLPFIVLEGALLIPVPAGAEEERNRWRSELRWEDAREEDFKFLTDYVDETLKGITIGLNVALGELIRPIKEIAGKWGKMIEAPDVNGFYVTCSGIWDNHANSNTVFQPGSMSGSTITRR